MKKTIIKKKSGFSLIELSIVLIIIGLLIAGITGGASLIKSSELRSIMGEARGYAVSVNSFFTQYDMYPGDADQKVGTFSPQNGDRDNQIEFWSNASTIISEGLDAWYDLKDIGAIDLALETTPALVNTGTSPAVAFASKVPNTSFPGSKIKGAGWVFDYNASSTHNVVVLTGTTGALASASANLYDFATNNRASAVLSPPDAFSIDAKIDDGISNSGNVRASIPSSAAGNECANTSTATPAVTPAYTIATGSKKTCALTFRVDVST